jgi:hypothetical protein
MIEQLASSGVDTRTALRTMNRPEVWKLHQKHFPIQPRK